MEFQQQIKDDVFNQSNQSFTFVNGLAGIEVEPEFSDS